MQSLTIIGRRWFQKGPGNTYHSVVAVADGKEVVNVGFAYGYGDQYLRTAVEGLEKAGLLPDFDDRHLRLYCERKGITYTATVADVGRKCDL